MTDTTTAQDTAPATLPHIAELERLHIERAELAGSLETLRASAAKLREAANVEAAVLAEIGELGRGEIAAMTAWATGGCVGDPPSPDQKKRRTLAEKLAAAQAAATAAKGAGQDIDQQLAELGQQARDIENAIHDAALDVVVAEAASAIRTYNTMMIGARQYAVKAGSLARYLHEQYSRGGNDNDGNRYLERYNAMDIKFAEPSVSHPELAEAANDWSRRIATLRTGAVA